jgi:hypothetical protein
MSRKYNYADSTNLFCKEIMSQLICTLVTHLQLHNLLAFTELLKPAPLKQNTALSLSLSLAHGLPYACVTAHDLLCKYKVVQIWPGLTVCKQVTVCPGHIWTTLYNAAQQIKITGTWLRHFRVFERRMSKFLFPYQTELVKCKSINIHYHLIHICTFASITRHATPTYCK